MELKSVLYGLARAIADRLSMLGAERETITEESFASDFLPRAIEALDGRPERLILLFDEVDALDGPLADANFPAREFVRCLSDLILQEPRLGYILVVGRNPDDLSLDFKATLGKELVHQHVGRLSQTQTLELIREPSQGYLDFTDDACQRLYTLTAGHPYCTQLLCNVIWNQRTMSQPSPPAQVTDTHVEAALQPALDMGGTGLDWIFDGLPKPAHRLFLAALAEVSEPKTDTGASLEMIHQALWESHVLVDDIELSRAPVELRQWDMLTPHNSMMHVAVPMIGVWIQQKRSLSQIKREIRYVNPRAQDHYEKARKAHLDNALGLAINEYRHALNLYPLFLDAHHDLATALRERREPGDLDDAIKAHEHVLDLDPETPPNAFLEVLLSSLESPIDDVDTIVYRYKKIKNLDKQGQFTSQAEGIIRNDLIPRFRRQPYAGTEKIYDALGDSEMADIIRRSKKTRMVMSYVMMSHIFIFSLLGLFPNS